MKYTTHRVNKSVRLEVYQEIEKLIEIESNRHLWQLNGDYTLDR